MIKNEATTNNDVTDYQFSLSHLRERNGRLQGTDDISSGYGNNEIGNYYFWLGDYETAYEFYQLALERDASDAVFWSNSCGAQMAMGEYNAALDDCNSAIVIEPELISGLDYRGRIYNALGYYGMALIDYETLMEIEPEDYIWPFLAALQNLFVGRGDAALEQMELYGEISGDDPNEDFWLGLANLGAGNYADAREYFERSVESSFEAAAFDSLWLAFSYQLDGREDDAEEAFDAADRAYRELDEEEYAGQRRFYRIFDDLVDGNVEGAQDEMDEILDDFPYAHQHLVVRLYLAMLSELFPAEPAYAEMRDWLNSELNIES
jgi:tetratricopeptide (TPR) repeat protein